MSTKKELKLLTELLNLEGVKVSSHRQYAGIGIILQIEASDQESVCGRCGSNSSKLHQNRWHIIKDLSWGEKAVLGLGEWLSTAQKYFVNSQSTIVRWFDEILTYFDNRTTSGVVEGINNKLKLIKRSAYGFTNFENFRNRCLLNWHFNC